VETRVKTNSGEFVPLADTGADAYLALPEPGAWPAPGVIVCHAWWGRNDFIIDLCDRLAAEGFIAFAPDVYAGQTTDQIDEAERLVNALSGDDAERIVSTALDVLRAQPAVSDGQIGIVGFSLGAAYALSLAASRPADLGAVVIFYGTNDVDATRIKAAVLGHFAPGDSYEPDEWVDEVTDALRAAGCSVTVHRYPGTLHWFMESDRPDAHAPEAAELAWSRSLDFLREHL
jgi:carboxymethylenebutenolidase